jgi:hypothetical protein
MLLLLRTFDVPSRRTRRADLREEPGICGALLGVSDGARTHDRLDHNQELYQLSYAHHVVGKV